MKKEFSGYVEATIKSVTPDTEVASSITIEGYASKMVVDRDGELVLPNNIDLTEFNKNPIVLFNHNQNNPIGKVVSITPDEQGLKVTAIVYKDMNEVVFNGVKNGVLKTFSIGFRGVDGYYDREQDIFIYTKAVLYELSVVSIPANQEALFDTVSVCEDGKCRLLKSFKNKGNIELEKKAIKNNVISTDRWQDVDKTELKQFCLEKGREYIKEAFLVVPDIELRSTWKFPHHEVKGEDLVLNRDGVIAAYAALEGARRKPNISPEQKLQAAKHLLKHYRELVTQEVVSEIPAGLKDMVKELTVEVEKLYSNVEETKSEKGVKMDKESVLKLIAENTDTGFGELIKGGVDNEYMVNMTDKSMLTAYPKPPLGYTITRYFKNTGGFDDFVIGRGEVAKLLNLMNSVFKDRDDAGNKKELETEEEKALDPIDVFKEIWNNNPDTALKAFGEVENFINTELSNLLNTNKGE